MSRRERPKWCWWCHQRERGHTHADRRFEFFSSLALDWPTLTPMVCRQAGRFSCTALGFTYLHIYISQRASEWGFGNARGRSRDVIAERESASMRWGLCFRALYGSRRLCSPLEARALHIIASHHCIAALEICCEIVDLLSRSTPTRTQAVGVPFKCHPRPRLSRVPRCVCVCVCV